MRTLRFAALLTVAVLLIGSSSAGAEGPLASVVTHHQLSLHYGASALDPTCPWSTANALPFEQEQRHTLTATYGSNDGDETLYISYCEEHTSAEESVPYNGGMWSLVRSDGTVSGAILNGGSSNFENGPITFFILQASNGGGSLQHAKGNLFFWTCSTGGGLRLTPKRDFSNCRTT